MREGGTAWGSGDGGHFTEEGDVIAPSWRVSLWLKLHGDLSVRVSVAVPDRLVCKPVHQFCCCATTGAWEIVANAVHGAHSVFRPPRGGGVHTAHCFVQRLHHGHSPVP